MKFRLRQESGKSPLGTYLLVLSIAVLFALGTYFVPPYLQYYRLKQAFEKAAVDSSHLADNELRNELSRALLYLDPPFDINDVAITRVGDVLIIDVLYKVKVDLPRMKPIVLRFNPHIERSQPPSQSEP